jgi:hypothetical protein
MCSRNLNEDSGGGLSTAQRQHLAPKGVVLRTAQAGRERRTTCTRLDNKVKPEQLILNKTYPIKVATDSQLLTMQGYKEV